MALNAATLGTAIYNALIAQPNIGYSSPLSAAQVLQVQALANAIALAVVAHITANAQVVVASVSGVTVGAGVSGPGTGTIT